MSAAQKVTMHGRKGLSTSNLGGEVHRALSTLVQGRAGTLLALGVTADFGEKF